MNRIILIGNGFDLAHGLETKYEHFIDWYWEYCFSKLPTCYASTMQDDLCCFELLMNELYEPFGSWHEFCYHKSIPGAARRKTTEEILGIITGHKCCLIHKSSLFERICNDIETKGWVDIEEDYYQLLIESIGDEEKVEHLNRELECLQQYLIEFLNMHMEKKTKFNDLVDELIYEPIAENDISREGKDRYSYFKHTRCDSQLCSDAELKNILRANGITPDDERIKKIRFGDTPYVTLPDQYMFLDFNYTSTTHNYLKLGRYYNNEDGRIKVNHIHGELSDPKRIIFGYGDELDERYQRIQSLNKNLYLNKIKSVRYLETRHYRDLLSFIESDAYQIYIMGHSCGNSDRTLLNTLFEHNNCVSIKPFYYEKDGKDNYLDLVQNISRNFTDPKKFRDRVVNKEYCRPLPQISTK